MFQVGKMLKIQQVFEESDVGALVVDMEHLKKASWIIMISDVTSSSYVEHQDIDGST